MDKVNAETAMEEMTLMLLYLTCFREKYCCRSWKGYDFGILDKLGDKDMIIQGRNPSKCKSVVLTDEGIKASKELLDRYGIEFRTREG